MEGGSRVYQEVALQLFLEEAMDTRRYGWKQESGGRKEIKF